MKGKMYYFFQDTKIGKYKKWDNGGQKNSSNTSQNNYIPFEKACQQT